MKRNNVRQTVPLFLTIFVTALFICIQSVGVAQAQSIATLGYTEAVVEQALRVQASTAAADAAQTVRWLAMAHFYEDAGLLSAPRAVYTEAVVEQALRVQASTAAAEAAQTVRWLAMAHFYEDAGLLSAPSIAAADTIATR